MFGLYVHFTNFILAKLLVNNNNRGSLMSAIKIFSRKVKFVSHFFALFYHQFIRGDC